MGQEDKQTKAWKEKGVGHGMETRISRGSGDRIGEGSWGGCYDQNTLYECMKFSIKIHIE